MKTRDLLRARKKIEKFEKIYLLIKDDFPNIEKDVLFKFFLLASGRPEISGDNSAMRRPEVKNKMSIMFKGRTMHPVTDRMREVASLTHKGKSLTKEHINKIQETRQKLYSQDKIKKLYGASNPAWKGGIFTRKDGYTYVKKSIYHFLPLDFPSDKDNYVKRANVNWFEKTGEIIKQPFILHHKNENKSDDRFENLQKMTRKEHMAIHREMLNKSLINKA